MLEVLIASTILVAVIGVSTMAYNTAIRSKILARKHLEISQSIPFILSDIRRNIRSAQVESITGEGSQGEVSYQWLASVSLFEPPFEMIDAESGTLAEFENRYRLWEVSIDIRYKDYQKAYQVQEVSW